MIGDWRLVGDAQLGGQVGYGLKRGRAGTTVLQLSVPFANAELDPGDAYRLATGILEQLRAGGFLPSETD